MVAENVSIANDDVIDEGAFYACKALEVEHYTDTLFRFRTARPDTLRFRAGEFVMIGLKGEKKPILRAYSVASPTWDETLEFYSIKVEDGALTSRLREIRVGDYVQVGRKPVGTLVFDALRPGRRLYMLSTGTGAAPFASVIREPEAYDRFGELVLTHTCRTKAELQYTENLVQNVKSHEFLGDVAREQLIYFNSVTREDAEHTGRITDLIRSGELFKAIERGELNPAEDRVMICGSMAMLEELKDMLEAMGFEEGSNAKPGDYVVEKAFAGDGI